MMADFIIHEKLFLSILSRGVNVINYRDNRKVDFLTERKKGKKRKRKRREEKKWGNMKLKREKNVRRQTHT